MFYEDMSNISTDSSTSQNFLSMNDEDYSSEFDVDLSNQSSIERKGANNNEQTLLKSNSSFAFPEDPHAEKLDLIHKTEHDEDKSPESSQCKEGLPNDEGPNQESYQREQEIQEAPHVEDSNIESSLGEEYLPHGEDSFSEDSHTQSETPPDERGEGAVGPEEAKAYMYSRLEKQFSRSSLDELLFDLYDKHGGVATPSYGSSNFDESTTDCGSVSSVSCEIQHTKSDSERSRYTPAILKEKDESQLKEILIELAMKINQKNTQLVKCLRNRERLRIKEGKHCDMVTAVLQAWSGKTSSDAKLRFSVMPVPGQESYKQWRAAITALVRRPIGFPGYIRRRVWLSLATEYIERLQVNWPKVVSFAFNDKCNPDDDALGAQIVKDLHRTGCSGVENAEDRVILKRVLLGYARWNKITGYCQGLNIIAALILNVTNKNEVDALKVMIYIVDCMLPKEYFAHNLRALTVDMAVFRCYLNMKLPKLSNHLERLQRESMDSSIGINVEPPLTNVFTMQWFLTMFATCLPLDSLLRIWDCVVVDGSEILIRTALAIWTKLARRVIRVSSADEFYMKMGQLTSELERGDIITCDEIIQSVYSMAPMPLPKLAELREKFMYDITPFNAAVNSADRQRAGEDGNSSDDYLNDMDNLSGSSPRSVVSTYHSLDINVLRRQYGNLTKRQKQASLMMKVPKSIQPSHMDTMGQKPFAINHLFVGKNINDKKSRHGSSCSEAGHGAYNGTVTPATPSTMSTKISVRAAPLQDDTASTSHTRRSSRESLTANKPQSDLPRSQPSVNGMSYRAVSTHPPVYPDSSVIKQRMRGERHEYATSKERELDNRFKVAKERQKISNQQASSATSPNEPKRPSFSHQLTPQKSNGDGTSIESLISPTKLFNPFPKPANGILSAEKARIGVKLGLYKARDAMVYMNRTEKTQFLNDHKQEGVSSRQSSSSIW